MKNKLFFSIKIIAILGFFQFSLAQIPNPGFEIWQKDANNDNNPSGWSTSNSDPDISVSPYTPAYAGNYSMKVSTFDPGFMAVPGFAESGFSFTQRPAQFNICYKTKVMPGDKVYIIFSLYRGDSIVASPTNCTFVLDSSVNNFTCKSFKVAYQSSLIPDSAYIMIVAGSSLAKLGTEIIVDQLSFGSSSNFNFFNYSDKQIRSYPNPATDYTYITVNLKELSDFELIINDFKGSLVQNISYNAISAGRQDLLINTSQLGNGIYNYSLKAKDFICSGKIVVCK